MVNCHPVLIPQIARRLLDMDMPATEIYNQDRDAVFEEIMRTQGITRDAAKQFSSIALYNGKLADTTPAIFRAMQTEVRAFTIALIKSKLHDELYQHIKSQEKNTYGSFLSLIVQTEERRCLEAMMDYLTSIGLQVDVLAYDGCMTRGTNNITDEILRGCEQAIEQATGYHIELKIKPMSVLEDLEIEADEAAKDSNAAYLEMKALWEQNHFYFKPSNTIVEVVHGNCKHYQLEHAMEAFNSWKLPGKADKPELFLKLWREDASRRMIDTMVYKPQADCAPNEFSLFSDFAYKKLDAPKDPIALDHFIDLVLLAAGDDSLVAQYLTEEFAHMIKKPCEKTGTCVILSSATQGTGKDTLMGWMMKLMGNHVAHYSSGDIFWDKHDTMQEGAVMMYLEEAGAENRTRENALKARITCDTININPKGIRGYTVPNIARYFMTTNEINPVKLDETDRRFLITSCSTRRVGQHEYWLNLHTQLATNPSWLTTIGQYLETYDISNWNPRRMPSTQYKQALQEASIKSEKMFLQQWGGERVSATEIYQQYRDYCMQRSIPYCTSSKSFAMALVPYLGNMVAKCRSATGIQYSRIGEAIPEVDADV
jgi:putative DNA primase/helicase